MGKQVGCWALIHPKSGWWRGTKRVRGWGAGWVVRVDPQALREVQDVWETGSQEPQSLTTRGRLGPAATRPHTPLWSQSHAARPQPHQTLPDTLTRTHPLTRTPDSRWGAWQLVKPVPRCLALHWQRLSDRKAGWAPHRSACWLPAPPWGLP